MKTQRTRTNGLALLCLAALATAAPADEPPGRTVVPGESPSAVQRLESARKLARAGQLPEAIDEYQRLLDEAGDKLARLGPQHLVQVRWLCHRDLAALPPAGLRLYRNRVDARARKWLEEGAAARDPAPLRRVVQEAFCSRAGDRALDLLGDLAFERGDFAEAGRWWRRVARPVGEAPARGGEPDLDLVFPDPQVDVARVRAKQVLAALFQEDARQGAGGVRAAVQAFRQAYPKAEGALAGRTGNYGDILAGLLGDPAALATPDAAAWTSYGGDPSRSLVLPPDARDPNRLVRLVRRWRFDLETHERLENDPPPPPGKVVTPSLAARSLAFHPLIVGGQVLVADARFVTAYDMHTGRAEVWYDAAKENAGINPDLSLPAAPDLRYTLTAAGGCVFARLGVQCVGAPGMKAEDRESVLVCLGLRPDAKGERFRWQARPEAANAEGAVFEGAPLVADGRVYAAVTRFAAGRTVTAVHCYPVQAEGAPPLRWRQDVCETLELKPEGKRCRQHLLTLAGPNVVYCSHSGAVVALDAATGKPVWARRYPSRAETDDAPPLRDLAPPVYAGGRLFVAPADGDRILCLDPATGQLLWQRDRVEVVQLLGVARGRLIFTSPDGIRAVGAATGDDHDGWVQPDVGRLPPFGRGFLAGDYVFWPTRQRLYVLNQADGQQPADLYPGPWQEGLAGNLVCGDGCLAAADARTLTVCVPPAWLQAERRGEAEAQPQAALPHYRLALAEADAGHHAEALAELDRAERLATPGEGWLPGLARRARLEALFDEADQAKTERRWDEAAAALRQAAAGQAVPERLEALRREAELWDAAGQPARAAAAWQEVLADAALRSGHLPDAHHNLQSAALMAARQVGERRGLPPPSAEKIAGASQAARSSSAPGLTLPLLHGWEVALAPGERLLPAHGAGAVPSMAADGLSPDPLFLGRGRELVCRDATSGRISWSHLLPFVVDWVGRHEDTLLAAGPGGAACLRLGDGGALWTYPAPAGQPLGDFRLTSSRLLCRLGECLAALDAETGWVLWTAAAPSAGLGLPPPSGRFLTYQAGEEWVVAQTAGGRLWVLDSATGRLAHDLETTREPWPRPPLALDGRHFCALTGPGTVVVLDAAAGAELARPPLGGPTTLSGRAPLAVGGGDVLLVVADRNFGATLQRFDPHTGKALWDDERPVATDSVTPGEVTCDREAVYVAVDGLLSAYALDTGKPLWRVALPGPNRRWHVMPAGDCLLACPADVGTLRPLVRSIVGSVGVAGAYPPREVPALLCDPKTGAWVERLNLRTGPAAAGWTWQPGGPLVPRLAVGMEPVRIQFLRQGLAVAVPGAVWERAPADPEGRPISP